MVQNKNPLHPQPTIIKIGDKWVNVNVWKKRHPGGAAPLERYVGNDATDAFMALHSQEAVQQVLKMKSVEKPRNTEEPKLTKVTLAFREWREQLEKEGKFERTWTRDAFHIGLMLTWCVSGYMLAYTHPLIAMVLLGLGMQQAGWIGHDYSHGRGQISYMLGRAIAGGINGFSPEWWSEKHNTHHVHPNQHGVDSDIANDPILHLHFPKVEDDFVLRPYQHIYYHFAYAFLYFSWRYQSFQHALKNKYYGELAFIVLNYTILLTLPLNVVFGAILIGGFLVAEIVTATHQSEDFFDEIDHNFVDNQFKTTRDVHMNSAVLNYIWGGMQFQLIHHLFPTMPRYYYAEMVPRIFEFAKKTGIEYRTAGMVEIFKMNYNTMKKFAAPKATKTN